MSKWAMVKLEEICDLNMGQSPESSSYNQEGEGIPFYQGNADFGELNPKTKFFCNKPTKIATKNDILVSVRAPIGALNIATETCCIGRGLAALTAKENISDTKFLYYVLKRKNTELNQRGTGSTFKAINKQNLREVLCPLPPLETQKQIAKTLDTATELLTMRKQQLAEFDNLIKSTFYDIFGDPSTNEKGWQVSSLRQCCNLIKDGPHASPSYVDYGIPFISVNNIIKGYWDLENVKYITREDYEKFSNRCKPEFGDVLYTKGGTTGFAKYVDIDFEFMNWVHIAVLKYNRELLNGIFLENMLNSDYCYNQSQRYTRGIANRDLVLSQMSRIRLFTPPLTLQNQFATIVTKIEEQKALVIKAVDKTQYLFDSLMSKYFESV